MRGWDILRILILDDEKEIADLVALLMQNEGYATSVFYNSRDALNAIKIENFDLCVLDVMLPEIDGLGVLKEIRDSGHTYPVIMLTAKCEAMDKVKGLANGADDYVTKPFDPMELISRVKAQLRRAKYYSGTPQPTVYDRGGLYIDCERHTCSVFDEPIELTPTEFRILWLLCQNAGKVISTEDIFSQIWGEKYLDGNNTVMVHIRRIREKLGDRPREPKFIKTVWGVGYKIEN
ncbi:MAG: response regulator transcription factor [Ruminococcaceae bacterium]|nr:response regulator transcription factor [Oscillospiraceae bacterium]